MPLSGSNTATKGRFAPWRILVRYTLRVTRLFACLALAVSQWALAQAYPVKPVRMVVGLAPGGATDIMARTLAPALGEELGQPVVVDNRPGAAGSIGAASAAKAPPDGYTLFLASSSFTSNAVLQQNGSYDPLADFEPITNIASAPFLLGQRRRTCPSARCPSFAQCVQTNRLLTGRFASRGTGTPRSSQSSSRDARDWSRSWPSAKTRSARRAR